MQKLLILLILGVSMLAYAQDKKEMTPEEKAWMEYMTPGAMHEHMAKMTGEWKTHSTFWNYPGAEAQSAEGKLVNEMILGGRYLKGNYSGDMMGMPFEGISFEAYDNAAKKFFNVWIDNFGTGIMTGVGEMNKETNELHYELTFTNMMDGTPAKAREVFKFIDDDHMLMEMYMTTPDGTEWKSMEIKYDRVK